MNRYDGTLRKASNIPRNDQPTLYHTSIGSGCMVGRNNQVDPVRSFRCWSTTPDIGTSASITLANVDRERSLPALHNVTLRVTHDGMLSAYGLVFRGFGGKWGGHFMTLSASVMLHSKCPQKM
ncbi:hypothetical protein CBL_08561 [Carabus blaptoides fortunei]